MLHKNLEKRKCLYYTVGQTCPPVRYITNIKVRCIFLLPPLRTIYGYISSSECSVKVDYNDTSDKLSGTLKYISRLEGYNE